MALSSAESELYAVGTAVTEALHLRNFLSEAFTTRKINTRIYTDSSSAKSIAIRQGSSKKAKHIELKHLFIQRLVQEGITSVLKIRTDNNHSDIFTKYIAAETLNRHLYRVGLPGHPAARR